MSVYACSDLHGRYDLYLQIKAFLKPDDKVYFLGDAGDRGPDSWKLIEAIHKNNQFICLKGNHEDMLVKAMEDFLLGGYYDFAYYLLYDNGGFETFNSWLDYTGASGGWCNHLKKLPLVAEYDNKQGIHIIMTHAGFTPNKNYNPIERELLWNRTHFNDKWPDDCAPTLIVHGHTPTKYLAKILKVSYEPGALWYCDNHKVCLDVGAYATNYTCLLDLDTFDEHIISINVE